jgi:N-acetylglutamate synthase-like GNAT family acetyltransferase
MILNFILAVASGFVLGCVAMHQVGKLRNLTTEEYAHCVQIVMNDYDKSKGDAQRLLLELQNYATNDGIDITDLSKDGIDIVMKVQDMRK